MTRAKLRQTDRHNFYGFGRISFDVLISHACATRNKRGSKICQFSWGTPLESDFCVDNLQRISTRGLQIASFDQNNQLPDFRNTHFEPFPAGFDHSDRIRAVTALWLIRTKEWPKCETDFEPCCVQCSTRDPVDSQRQLIQTELTNHTNSLVFAWFGSEMHMVAIPLRDEAQPRSLC